jgi:hypothetical protein
MAGGSDAMASNSPLRCPTLVVQASMPAFTNAEEALGELLGSIHPQPMP